MAASNMKQHFIYPVRLTKILLGIYYGSTTNNSSKKISTNNNKNKISTNSHLLNQLQLCHKRDQQNVDEEENNFIWNSYSLRSKLEKSRRTPSRACLPSSLWPATLLIKSLCHRCFPVNFAKFLRTSFFTGHFRWLLLYLLQKLKVVLMWSCLLSYLDSFQLFGTQS